MILKNKVIVFLGNTRFDSPIQSTALFIAKNFAKENKVYFIDYPFTLKDYYQYISSNDHQERSDKFSIFSDGLLETEIENLKILITPPVLPINFLPEGFFFRKILKFNESILSWRLKKTLKKDGVKEFIFINSFNFHYPNIAQRIKPALTVYHCVDPMIMPYDKKHGIISEHQLVKQSDLVICTSRALFEEKKNLNSKTYFVANATASDHSQLSKDLGPALHPKLEHLQKPIVGYLGTIERRINYDLVIELAKMNPEKSFVFAGPLAAEHIPEEFYSIPNIILTGSIPYEEVPQLINSFDLAIIPFKKDEVSRTIFPIKLFEYLSAGKPIVMTDFNLDLKEFTEDSVLYCENVHSFSAAIDIQLREDSKDKINTRQLLAKENTWENRAAQIDEILSHHLADQLNSASI